jgi:hypothetical protein
LNQPFGTPLALVLLAVPSFPREKIGTPSTCCECFPFLDPLRFVAGFFVPSLESAKTSQEMLFSHFESSIPILDGTIIPLTTHLGSILGNNRADLIQRNLLPGITNK